MGDSARPDEGVQGRPLHADVLAELDVVDAALGDEAADESLAGAQVLARLAGGQQLVGTGLGDANGSVGHGLGIHGGTMTRPPPVFLLSAASSPVASQESRCPSPLTTRRRNWSRIAYLAGGHVRVADTAVVTLVERGQVRVAPDGQLSVLRLRRRHPVEAAALDAIGTRGWRSVASVRWRFEDAPRLSGIAERLAQDGLLRPKILPFPGRR